MLRWGREDRPVDRGGWWTSYNIDGAFIIPAEKVEVLEPWSGEPMTTASCASCTEDAIGLLNGTPLCQVHLREVQEEWIHRKDAQQKQEARRLGIEIPPEVLRDREFGPAVWLLSTPYLASKTWRYVDLERRQVQWDELLEACRPGRTTNA